MPQKQTHQWNVPFRVPMSKGPLHLVFLLSSIKLIVFLLYQSVNFLYQHFLLAAYLDTTELFQSWISEALQSPRLALL